MVGRTDGAVAFCSRAVVGIVDASSSGVVIRGFEYAVDVEKISVLPDESFRKAQRSKSTKVNGCQA